MTAQLNHNISVCIEADTMDRPQMGTAVYARNVVQHLVESDSNLDISLFHSKPTGDHLYKKVKELFIPKIKTPLALLLSNMAFYMKMRGQFDIVHYPRQTLFPLFWLPGNKTVVSIHDAGYLLFQNMTDGHQYFGSRSFSPTRRLRDWSLQYGHRWVDAVIAPSQSAKVEINKYYGIPSDKIHVIPYGKDPIFKPLPDKEDIRSRLYSNHGIKGPFILNVGRIQPHKNVRRLVEAFGKLKHNSDISHKLVIIGQHYESTEEVKALIKRLGISEEIYLLGGILHEELVSWYNAADFFVYPSLHEGFGLPPLEAMSCGTPVITSNVTSMPEVVGDAGILIDPKNVEEIAESMGRLAENQELKEELSQKSLQRAKQFSWEKYVKQLLELYQDLLKTHI